MLNAIGRLLDRQAVGKYGPALAIERRDHLVCGMPCACKRIDGCGIAIQELGQRPATVWVARIGPYGRDKGWVLHGNDRAIGDRPGL